MSAKVKNSKAEVEPVPTDVPGPPSLFRTKSFPPIEAPELVGVFLYAACSLSLHSCEEGKFSLFSISSTIAESKALERLVATAGSGIVVARFTSTEG
jgi:hypothetical protein